MKRVGILGKVLRHTWAIDERYALASGGMIAGLLAGNEFDGEKAVENENAKPFAIIAAAENSGRTRVSAYDQASRGSIAVIPVRGPLMKEDEENCGEVNSGMATLGNRVQEADQHPNIGSIILIVDSPGGTVDGTQAFADAIKNTSKPVVTFVDGLMASAALWAGSSANHIIAENSSTEIGSIGVMFSFADVQPMWEKEGVKFHRIVSDFSQDKNKDFTDALQGDYKGIKENSLNPLAQIFIDNVKSNRADKIKSEDVFTGKVYLAEQALELGLIDEIGSFDTAVERAFELSRESYNNTGAGASASLSTNSSNPPVKMKQLAMLCALLAVSQIEATEDGVFFSTEQAEAIEDRLAQLSADVQQAQTDLEAARAASGTLETAQSRIEELEAELAEVRSQAGADTSKVIAAADPSKNHANGPVVQDGDDIMTAIDKVSEAYL